MKEVIRDTCAYFGWQEKEAPAIEFGSQIYAAEKAVERAFHLTGVAEYLEYNGVE